MADLVPILLSSALQKAGFAHGFSTRAGGVSEPPYETLDFALLREPSRLEENQRRLGEAVGFPRERLFQTRQVHGRALVVAAGDPKAFLEIDADALVAEPGSGAAVAVRVADCVPVLLADPSTGRVAAAHAGWRGVVAGVVGVALDALGRQQRVVAAIGPCIGACCFEVGADVAAQIARASTEEAIRSRDERGKAMVDLRRAVRAQLSAGGLADADVDDVGGCTRCDAKRFYSYRRDGDASGRLVGVIVAR
ncbi:MAG: laccase domain-containing protein [Labilithrix sp.]|nr:laccase domain-containing protein [Labilithrix sp.]